MYRNSLRKTAPPHSVKKRVTEMGETSSGLHSKKYRVVSNGEKNAMPNPPLVMASRTPCEAVAMKKKLMSQASSRPRVWRNSNDTTNKAQINAKSKE